MTPPVVDYRQLRPSNLMEPRFRHLLYLLYWPLYGLLFMYVERFSPIEYYYPIYSPLDDYIPFCELFVIPYFLWFAYIAAGYVFFMLASRKEFIRLCIFLYTGMTVCLIIYTLFPNGQKLRVDYSQLGRDNILIGSIKMLQSSDTPFNVFPSIHCLNSIAMHIAIQKSKKITRYRKTIVISSLILCILIILSTVFTKQHSILDVYGAIGLSVVLYIIAYIPKYNFIKE